MQTTEIHSIAEEQILKRKQRIEKFKTLGFNEDALKILDAVYDEWIQHPGTQQLINLLNSRDKKYTKDLTDQILVKSDKEFEDKQRSAISTVKAILKLVTTRDEFIIHSNKRDQTYARTNTNPAINTQTASNSETNSPD